MGGKKNSIVMSSIDRTVNNASNAVVSGGKKVKAISVRSASKHGSRQQIMGSKDGRDVSREQELLIPGIV